QGLLELARGDLEGSGHHGAHDLRHPPHAVVADEGTDEEFLGVVVDDNEVGLFEPADALLEFGDRESAGLAGPAAQREVEQAGVVEVRLRDEEQVEALLLLLERDEVGVLPDAGEDPAVATSHESLSLGKSAG